MFKNDLSIKDSHPLSKKEKKEIFSTLPQSIYNKDYIEIMTTNFKDLTISKINIQNKKRNVLFYEGNPILFEYDNKLYYPTVYLLQYFNFGIGVNIIKKFCLIFDETTEYILNGADLMLKGIINRKYIKKSNDFSFNLNDLFFIQTINGKIIGMGTAIVSKITMDVDNPKGKFLKVLHKVDDGLWNIGNRKEVVNVKVSIQGLNLNVDPDQVMKSFNEFMKNENKEEAENNKDEEEGIKCEKVDENKEEGKVINIDDNNNEQKKEEEENPNTNEQENENIISTSKENNEGEICTNKEIEIENKDKNENETKIEITNEIQNDDIKNIENKETENDNEEQNVEDVKETDNVQSEEKIYPPEEIDEHLDIVFLTLCKLNFFNSDLGKLPMDPGKLYQQFMKPLSEDLKLYIDIKQSSHKKINNYFKYLSKDKSLITFSKAKGQNNDYIQSINYSSPLYISFKPRIKKLKFSNTNATEQKPENILLSKDEKIEVQTLFKPNQKVKFLFDDIENENEKEYYTLKECSDAIKKYIKDKDLFVKDKNGMVRVDGTLKDILHIKFDDFVEDPMFRIEDIFERFKGNLKEKNLIMRVNNEESSEMVYNDNLKIKLISKKINGKNVTLVSGLDKFIDIKEACKSLAKHFACSVTIKEEIIGLKNAVFIQGYWINELKEKLIEEFKIKEKFIVVEDRMQKKKKK